MRLVLCAVLLTHVTPIAAAQQSAKPVTGEDVFRLAYERYSKTRFRTVTFVQKTTFPDGRVEWWYEAESIPGKARVDVAPFDKRNTSIFRNDSAYVWRDSTSRQGAGLAATMWTLMDMYAVPVSETVAALTKRNFDVSKLHESTHQGRPIYVVGALAGDTMAPQIWIDQERLYTVKMIVPTPRGRRTTDVGRHIFQNGGWIEQEIVVRLNGDLVLLEEYTQTKTNVELPAWLFDPDEYRAPPWPRGGPGQ
jgi:hypothetical protein